MRAFVFVLWFIIGWLFPWFHRGGFIEQPPQPPLATGSRGVDIVGQGHADPHNAKSYGPLKTWPCTLPDVCVHARHRAAP